MVSFHNFKSQNFKLSVSNPKSKYVVYVSVLSQISNCQSLGRKNKHELLKTDRMRYYMLLFRWAATPTPHSTTVVPLRVHPHAPKLRGNLPRTWDSEVERFEGSMQSLAALPRYSGLGSLTSPPCRLECDIAREKLNSRTYLNCDIARESYCSLDIYSRYSALPLEMWYCSGVQGRGVWGCGVWQ